jgi:hypothetical protein
MKNVIFAVLATLIVLSSAMVSLELPKQNFDDIAFLKYAAHSTPESREDIMDVVEAQQPPKPIIDRFEARLGTVHTYPLLLVLVSTLDRWFLEYDYLSVFISLLAISTLALVYLFIVRVRFPSEKTRLIDLAFLLLGLNITASLLGLWKFFPFTGGGYYWYDLYPRAVIEILFLSQLYLFFSNASARTKWWHGSGVIIVSFVLNVIFTAYLLLLAGVFVLMVRYFHRLKFLILFPSMLALSMLVGVSIGMHPHLTIRAVLWLLYTGLLLFLVRKEGDPFVRNAFVFLSAFCLAGQFFEYNAPDASLIFKEMMFRPLGLAGFFFMFLLAEKFSEKMKEQIALFLIVPIVLTAFHLWLQDPVRALIEKTSVSEVPELRNETDFFLYFSRER